MTALTTVFYVKMKFYFARMCYRLKPFSLHHPIFRSFIGPLSKNKAYEQICMLQIVPYAKQQIEINDMSKKWESVQVPIEQRSHFRWRCC